MTESKHKIGIFDSGIGGLTVLRSLVQAYPTQDFVYIGDLARLPYGNKSPATIRKYGEQMMDQLISLGAHEIIIACNTASSVFLGEKQFKDHVLFNVIEPGAQAALAQTLNKEIGVLGTRATIESHAYKKTLQTQEPQVQVAEVACPLLVPLAEEGWEGRPITQEIIRQYTDQLHQGIDTVILGCTHYPVLKNDLQAVLGEKICLIESGEVLIKTLKPFVKTTKNMTGTIEIYATDLTQQFKQMACRLIPHLQEVNIQPL